MIRYQSLLPLLLAGLLSSEVNARIDYINERVKPGFEVVEARGTCDHSRTTPFPGEDWRVMKMGGETSYQGPIDRGRSFADKSIEEWELALCQVSQRSVKMLLHPR